MKEKKQCKMAILVIDTINEYFDPKGKVFCEECRKIIPNLQKLLSFSRKKNIPVIYVNTSLLFDKEPIAKKWGLHAVRGTWGAKIIPELQPQEGDTIIFKRTYDGFYNTELELTLRSLDVDTVVVVGIHTHVCVLLTAVGAFDRGFNVIAIEDCMTTGYKPNHESRLRFYKTHLGELLTLEDFLRTYNDNSHEE